MIIGRYLENGVIVCTDGLNVPPDRENSDYVNLMAAVANGDEIEAFVPPIIAPAEVTAEMQRRIMLVSADARANMQIFGEPIPTEITTLCIALRAKAPEICAMTPIPRDFADDRYWVIN